MRGICSLFYLTFTVCYARNTCKLYTLDRSPTEQIAKRNCRRKNLNFLPIISLGILYSYLSRAPHVAAYKKNDSSNSITTSSTLATWTQTIGEYFQDFTSNNLNYTVKILLAIFPSPARMSLTKLFPARESLVSDMPATGRKIANLFYSVVIIDLLYLEGELMSTQW
jgi:hypothetical protein